MVSVTKDIIHVSFGTMNPLEEPMYILVPKKACLQWHLAFLASARLPHVFELRRQRE